MNITRPNKEDLDAAWELVAFLNKIAQGLNPVYQPADPEDEDDFEYLSDAPADEVFEALECKSDNANLPWIMTVLDTLLSSSNDIVDQESSVLDFSPKFKQALKDKGAALQAMNTMVASGSLSDAAVKQMLPTVMKTALAANADADDIANIVTKAKQAGFKEADIPALLDRAMQSGADGGFELKDMARWLPQQLAAMKSAGMGATLDNFSSLLNANQLAFMTAGSTDEAGNNLVNLLAKISSQDIVTKAKKIDINGQEGFDFTASMNKRQAAGMNSLDALVDIVSKIVQKDEKSAALMKQMAAAQGDEAKLALLENQKALVDGTAVGQLVSDRQALMALLSLINNKQEAARLQQGQANAAGAVDGAYQFVADGSGFKKEQLKTAYSEAEYGAFSSFTDMVANKLKGIADWARGNQEAAQTAVAAGQGAAAVSATVGTSSMVSGGWRFFQGGQGVAGAGRFLPSAGSMGAFTLGAAPLAAMGGVTHLAAQGINMTTGVNRWWHSPTACSRFCLILCRLPKTNT